MINNAIGCNIFAEWLHCQGYTVIQTENSYWFNQGPRIYQAFPYHLQINPGEAELNELLGENKAIGLRYSTSIHSSQGVVSYHVIYKGKEYSEDTLSKKARYDVRKGLKNCVVERISLPKLAVEGWQGRLETLIRQGRVKAESRDWWNKLCLSASDLPGFEAWGAISDGNIVASLLGFRCDNCFSILYQQSKTNYLSLGVNNALTFVVTKEIIERPEIDYIFYGLNSLDAPPSVDAYKFRMNYTALPVRQRVVFNPWLAPAFNNASHSLLKLLLRWQPHNPVFAKAEGMIRFYLDGKRPLNKQTWPEALIKQKQELLTI